MTRRLSLAIYSSFVLLSGTVSHVYAQTTVQEQQAYQQTLQDRTTKIIEDMGLRNDPRAGKLQQLIIQQYTHLNNIQSKRDTQLAQLKKENASAQTIDEVQTTSAADIKKLHRQFLKQVAALGDDLVEVTKNGMTYNVVPLTYNNYLLMLPYLSEEEKTTIHNFLVEAREIAMDGGSSKEKHGWFNKYKGKIAIYLGKRGYNMKKEGEYWAVRRNAASEEVKISRAAAIADTLRISDSYQKESVRNLVVYQYQVINRLKVERDTALQQIKTASKGNQAEDDTAVVRAWTVTKAKMDSCRNSYLAKLSQWLSPQQINLVKNEMTRNNLAKEYNHFLALLPTMTEPQKQAVYNYLVEARENALNVYESREMHQWFAKYRGRANNYLSKQGHNLRKATEELEARSK